jgi:arylsulfatase
MPNGNQPSLLNTSYTITADIDVPQGGAEGVIIGEGGRFAEYGLYLVKSKPVFTYNALDVKRTRWEGQEALAPGKHTIVYDFKYDGLGAGTLAYNNVSGVGSGGTGTLKVDGTVVSTEKMEHTIPLALPLDQTFNIGTSGATPVDDRDYKTPFPFTGKINKETLAVDRPKLTPEDVKRLEEANQRHDD